MKKEYADFYCDCIDKDCLDDNVLDEDALYEEEDILFASQKPYDIRTYPYSVKEKHKVLLSGSSRKASYQDSSEKKRG